MTQKPAKMFEKNEMYINIMLIFHSTKKIKSFMYKKLY